MFFEAEKKECAHVWKDVCIAFSPRLNAEGVAVRCEKCGVLGLQRARASRATPEGRLRFEIFGEPTLVKGTEVFQAEYLDDGRPHHIWDAHL
jgi:hypothetical protein